jgi:hypothetical protein
MKPVRNNIALLAITLVSLTTTQAQDPLPSWNDVKSKQSHHGIGYQLGPFGTAAKKLKEWDLKP